MPIGVSPDQPPNILVPFNPTRPFEDLLDILRNRDGGDESETEDGEGTGGSSTGNTRVDSSGDTVSDVTGNTDVDINGNTNITRTGRFREESDIIRVREIIKFIDVPTAEAVLDDFETGFEGFLAGMRQQGLSQTDMGFARDSFDSFFNDFLGDLALRAANGEDVFTVVGVDANEVFLGERLGGASETTTTGTETTTGQQTEESVSERETREREEREQSTQTDQTSTATQDGESSTRTESDDQTRTDTRDETTTVDQEETTNTETDNVTEIDQRETDFEIEQIVQRDRIDVVRSTSPGQFLSGRFSSPGALSTAVRSRAGQEDARRRRGTSGIVSGARQA